MGWFDTLPIYVTRKNADGFIATYSLAVLWTTLIMLVVAANIIIWGFISLYEAFNFIF